MNKKKRRIILGTLGILLLMAGTCGIVLYQYILAPQFYPLQTTRIYIDRDDTLDSVYHKIYRQGKANNLKGFLWLARYDGYPDHIHTGCYVIHPKENVLQVFNRLRRGQQQPINLTIGSTRTLDQLAHNIGKQLMMDSAEIAFLMADSLFCQQLGYKKETLPSLFIPNTYQVYWNMNAGDFFKRMQKEHHRFWNQERLNKANAISMTPEEVSTLASIVEEETNNPDEKPIVAGLYINRLHAGMPLQADPTIKFSLQNFTLRRITNEHLKTPSPYNTYMHLGLPPGPIRIPTPAGIDAVLNYTKHNYFYMCAKEDFSGTHNFASNYTQHTRNAQLYRNALNKRKIYQ